MDFGASAFEIRFEPVRLYAPFKYTAAGKEGGTRSSSGHVYRTTLASKTFNGTFARDNWSRKFRERRKKGGSVFRFGLLPLAARLSVFPDRGRHPANLSGVFRQSRIPFAGIVPKFSSGKKKKKKKRKKEKNRIAAPSKRATRGARTVTTKRAVELNSVCANALGKERKKKRKKRKGTIDGSIHLLIHVVHTREAKWWEPVYAV